MNSRPRSALTLALLGLITVIVTACGTGSSYLTPSASTTTMMAGWEQRLSLEWTTEPDGSNTRRVTGYIYNGYGESVLRVRVLAQALDQSGTVVGQRIEWVPDGVSGFERRYFIVPHLPVADRYRVTIWDYTGKQRGQ